jgi:hypothetical protein
VEQGILEKLKYSGIIMSKVYINMSRGKETFWTPGIRQGKQNNIDEDHKETGS